MTDLDGWRRRRIADGVVLADPAARTRLRIRPRVPLARLAAMLREAAESHGVAAPTALDRRRLVTGGELGVIAAGAIDARRELAIAIAGDGSGACVDAVGERVAPLVEAVLQGLGPGRGARRVRMFEYEPPPGWRGLRRDQATTWLPPEVPRNRAMITVHDARPLSTTPDERLHRLLFLRLPERDGAIGSDPIAVESAFGLSGRLRESRVPGAGTIRRAAAFGDDQFIYQATVEARADDHASLVAFDRMVRSFRPLPSAPAQASAAIAYLVE